MSSDMEGKMQLLYDRPQSTLAEELARSLREIMSANGRPSRSEYHHRDVEAFNEHIAQWNRAKEVLAWFEREQLSPTPTVQR
jgi:hypothetical protein